MPSRPFILEHEVDRSVSPESPAMHLIERLASLKLTLAIILALAAALFAMVNSWLEPTWALALPLVAFALNLGAAVLTHPVFRRNVPLLVFHLGLIAIVLLAACARLTYFEGSVELTTGQTFSAAAVKGTHGPLHAYRLNDVGFRNDGFEIEYDDAMRRVRTRSHLLVPGPQAGAQRVTISENQPLVLSGYRFYPTSNKGFAPVFTWWPASGAAPERGSVHLPSYPLNEYRQALEWELAGRRLWTMLHFDEVLIAPGARSTFRLPREYHLIVRIDDARHELTHGARLEIAGGTLVYEGLSTWMGYSVSADWTKPWLLAACLIAVLGLAWHFLRKFSAQPWSRREAVGRAAHEAQS